MKDLFENCTSIEVLREIIRADKERIKVLETELACKAGLLSCLGQDASAKLGSYKWRITELEHQSEKLEKQLVAVDKWIGQHRLEPATKEHVTELIDAMHETT